MANRPYYRNSPPVTSLVSHQEHRLDVVAHKLCYPSKDLGTVCAIDWELRDSSQTVGRLQGQTIAADKSSNKFWNLSANLVFDDQRFNFEGSTLVVQGRLGYPGLQEAGDWAVLGGTGKFVGAQGNIAYKRVRVKDHATTINLTIRVVCLTFPRPETVKKVGPWGGEGGTSQEIQDVDKLPRRLQSITIYADTVIQSIEFSYTDQAGRKHTSTPWGGVQNKRARQPIQLGVSETLTKINGSTGKYKGRTVVTSLTIVTSINKSYCYGEEINDDTPFRVVAAKDQSIVGFFGRADEVAVHNIGAYVCPN